MKTFPSKHLFTRLFASALLLSASCSSHTEAIGGSLAAAGPVVAKPDTASAGKKKIKIALLLDTSNSMDGLIEQAKSQLWKFVNALSGTTFEKEKPLLEIALYEYGNDRLPAREGHIRQVSMFTGDLDLVSEKLFSLTTKGGNEFCGQVIQTSLNQLEWTGDDGDLRIIFIAGNEPFNQGTVHYSGACTNAKEKKVIVNAIYCGSFDEGISGEWKKGADLTGGNYMSIEQDRKTVFIESPFDAEISQLNDKLNTTYIWYGSDGYSKKQNQEKQDKNAEVYGMANKTSRAVSKSSSFYSNSSWDLVDASKEKSFDISKIKEADLPQELRGKSPEERKKYVEQKNLERETIKVRIVALNKQRNEFIASKEATQPGINSLDAAMLNAIKSQASKKGYAFE